LPPIAGGAGDVRSERLILAASDGNRLRAFEARAADPDAPAVVILPDVRGLHPFYEDLALRFAQAGVHAVAFDYFGRTAGVGDRGDDFAYRSHPDRARADELGRDAAAAIARARSTAAGADRDVFTIGFCFGGRMSFNLAARAPGLAGVIGFYGWPAASDERDPESPISLVPAFGCPVLGLFGSADQGIPRESVDAFRVALREAAVPNEIVVYEGAPHSFFDRVFTEHRDACDDAWRRVLAFVGAPGA
jgi:carboxymethylenebutenolidase